MYQFSFELTEDDYLEFNKYHALESPAGKKAVNRLRFVIPIVLVVVYFVYLSLLRERDATAVVVFAAVFLIPAAASVFFAKRHIASSIKRRIKKLKKEGKLPYERDISLCFEEDDVIYASEESETKRKYGSIEKIAEGTSALYIYFNAMQAYIIPFSAFESAGQRQAFWDFIRGKAAQAKAVPRGN